MENLNEILTLIESDNISEANEVLTEGFTLDKDVKLNDNTNDLEGTFIGEKVTYHIYKRDLVDPDHLKPITDAVMSLEKEYPKYNKILIKELIKKSGNWLNDDQKNESYIKSKLSIIDIDVIYHKKTSTVYITIWRQIYKDFIKGNSLSSEFTYSNGKLTLRPGDLLIFEG